MKSYTRHISLLLLACVGLAACNEHDWGEMPDDAQCIELTVNCVNLNATRATMDGEDAYNENQIGTLHYFFYHRGKTDENAVMSGKISLDGGAKNSTVIRIPLSETDLNTVVFPRPANECDVYLIANLPDNVAIPENTSIDNLKALAVETDFANRVTAGTQQPFVMDSKDGVATIVSRNKTVAAKGEIMLDRLAAKFTARISVEESFTDTDGKVWTPDVENMTVHLDRVSSKTTLAGGFGDADFDYAARKYAGTKKENKVIDGTEKETTLYVFDPFYSYPREWGYSNDDAVVMYVMLPWKKEGTEQYKPCFYKVFPNTMQLNRNCWYNVDLNIGVLGSFSQTEEPVEIKDVNYKVVDWKNGFDDWSAGLEMNTELLDAYYLVVEQNEYVVNNKNTFEIPFISSHECTIEGWTVSRKVFGNSNNSVPTDEYFETGAGGVAENWLTLDGNTIKLNHALNNDFLEELDEDNPYDYTAYEFTCTLRHKNNSNFSEVITITQKPALSIEAHLNSLYEATDGGTITGYVYVNGNAPNNSVGNNYSNYGGVAGVQTSGTTNTNPYMYTIEVSVLPAGSEFIIGDPRVKYVFGTDIDAQTSFYPATPVDGGASRHLTNYYGTSKDASTENMIAPKFRVCSAHGRVSGSLITYQNAFNRAASYQEDGYPAGRWRVPTKAEIMFVSKLYDDGLIPPLFYGSTYAYWCATGKVNGTTFSDDQSGTSPLRSVYDEWYWEQSDYYRMESLGEHPNKYNQFTWGDEIN